MTHLSIVIPCYNEAGNLPALIDKCESLVAKHPGVEVVLVNNGSTDNSATIIADIISKKGNTNIRSHLVEVNQGYGFGILEGLKQTTADVICWTHADLQTDIFDCIKAYDLYKGKNEPNLLIKGRRKGRAFFDTLFTSLMSYYVKLKLGNYIPDINAQPKLFSRSFYNQVAAWAPDDFSLDLHFLRCAKRIGRIIEFPVHFGIRIAGEAKGGSGDIKLKIKLMKRTLNYINKIADEQIAQKKDNKI